MLMLALRLILKDKGGKQYCLFVDSNLGVEGTSEKDALKQRIETPLYTLYWGFQKILCKACLLFNCFLVIKGILKVYFLSFLDYWICLICLTVAQIRGKDIHSGYCKSVYRGSPSTLLEITPPPPPTLRYHPLWFP